MDWQKVNRDVAAYTYDALSKAFSENGSVPDKGLRFVIEENEKLTKVDRDIPLNQVSDFSILREAQRELGIK